MVLVFIGIISSVVLVIVAIAYYHMQYLADLDAKGLKEVCQGTGRYNDYTSYIDIGGVRYPQFHHEEIIECKVVPK